MSNIIDFEKNKPMSGMDINKMYEDHKEEFYAQYGRTPVLGEPEIISLQRELFNINTDMVSMAFIRSNTSFEQDAPQFTKKREDAEYQRAIDVLNRLRKKEKEYRDEMDMLDERLRTKGITFEENKEYDRELRRKLNLD